MAKQCPHCGYRSGFWSNRRIRYYCPECGWDMKPGKGEVKKWQRVGYAVGVLSFSVGTVGMVLLGKGIQNPEMWDGRTTWINRSLYRIVYVGYQLVRGPGPRRAASDIFAALAVFTFVSLLLAGLTVMVIFEVANAKHRERRRLLNMGGRHEGGGMGWWVLAGLGTGLGMVVGSALAGEALSRLRALVLWLTGIGLVVVSALLVTVTRTREAIRISREELKPIRWNKELGRLEETNEEGQTGNQVAGQTL